MTKTETPLRPLATRPLHRLAPGSDPHYPVRYRSRGRLLIIGEGPRVAVVVGALRGRLRITVLVPEASPHLALPADIMAVAGHPAALSGHLGDFRVIVAVNGARDPGAVPDGTHARFDLVLDLSQPPALDAELPPFGYYAPGTDSAALAQALEELPGLVGEFAKPKFFIYDPSLCAHSRKGLAGCTRCLDTCPAQSIQSMGDGVEADPHLCQGAGACTAVCPTGAIRYGIPEPEQTLALLRERLAQVPGSGVHTACVVIHEPGRPAGVAAGRGPGPAHWVSVEVPELPAAGLEVWLAALAYGAAQVVLLAPLEMLPSTRRLLDEQVETGRRILEGLGYEPRRLRILDADTDLSAHLLGEPSYPTIRPASFAPLSEKRTTLWLAVDHLHAQAPSPGEPQALLPGAPMGEVRVDASACTLCMGCTTVCPKGALRRGEQDLPELKFVESLCVQCGLCARACPEDAIRLAPRCLYERDARERSRVLNSDEPFRCLACGRAYSTRRVIERMTEQLASHPMFQGEGLKRLQLCERCRAVAAVTGDTEVVVYGLTPPRE